MTQDVLAENGYLRYEISNYAKKGYECRHNIGYWQRKEYLGVGLGAASLIDEVRYSNLTDLDAYIEQSFHVKQTEISDTQTKKEIPATNLCREAVALTKKAQMEEFMFLGLRMTEGIQKNQFYQAFGFTVDHIYRDVVQKLSVQELLVDTTTSVYLTDKGIDLSNYALAQFLL